MFYSKFKSEQLFGIFAFRLPQIVAIGPAFMQSIMITNFKYFVNNEFSYQVSETFPQVIFIFVLFFISSWIKKLIQFLEEIHLC